MKKVALSLILVCGLAVANEANATAAKADANATAPKAEVKAAAGDAEKGKALYAKCQACHGADGKMKALGKSNPIAGWDEAKIVEALKGYKAGTLNTHGMGGTMKGQAASLSDQDMADLAAYIKSLGK